MPFNSWSCSKLPLGISDLFFSLPHLSVDLFYPSASDQQLHHKLPNCILWWLYCMACVQFQASAREDGAIIANGSAIFWVARPTFLTSPPSKYQNQIWERWAEVSGTLHTPSYTTSSRSHASVYARFPPTHDASSWCLASYWPIPAYMVWWRTSITSQLSSLQCRGSEIKICLGIDSFSCGCRQSSDDRGHGHHWRRISHAVDILEIEFARSLQSSHVVTLV